MFAKVLFFVMLFSVSNICAQKIVRKNISPVPQVQTAAANEDELAKHLSAAETFQISGDLPNAANENRAIIGLALQRIGNLNIENGRYETAIKQLGESINYIDDAPNRTNLAVAYLRSNQLDEALEQARLATALDPKYATAHYILGNVYFTKQDYQAALPELEKVLILAPDFESARALGLTYLYLKQPERAKLLFEEMQGAISKESSELHILFGQAYEQTNYPLEAEREFKRASAVNPKQLKANFYLGYVILQYGGSQRLEEAEKAFENELKLTPDDFYSNFFAGVAASSENDNAKAVLLLNKAVQINPQSSEAHLFLGQAQTETGDLKNAEKNLRRAVELSGNASKNGFEARRTHYLLGKLLVADGRREEGEAELIKARELQTQLIKTTRDELSQLFSQVIGKAENQSPSITDQTAQKLNSSADLTPEKTAELKKIDVYYSNILAQAFYNLGVISVQIGDLPDALEKFAVAAHWQSDFPNLDRNWGIVAFRARKFDEAAAPLARHLKNSPQDNLARQMLGASYYFTGKFKDAVTTLKPLERTITDDPELAYFYGISLVQLERNQEALPIFDKLAQLSQKNPETLINAAQGFMILGDYQRAIKAFQTVSAVAPQTPKVNYYIGQGLIRLNHYDEAEKAFRKELEINPSDETAKYHLALTFIERKIKTDEAADLLNEAIAARPDYADAHYQLGKIYLERGDPAKAVEQLESAVSSDEKKDYSHYQLSIAYRKLSRTDDADRELKVYQKLKAENRKTNAPMGNNENSPK